MYPCRDARSGEPAGDAQRALPAGRERGRETGRQDGVAVDRAPVEPQPGSIDSRGLDGVAVLNPGSAARAAERRVEGIGKSGP